jgi:hypothetical protein
MYVDIDVVDGIRAGRELMGRSGRRRPARGASQPHENVDTLVASRAQSPPPPLRPIPVDIPKIPDPVNVATVFAHPAPPGPRDYRAAATTRVARQRRRSAVQLTAAAEPPLGDGHVAAEATLGGGHVATAASGVRSPRPAASPPLAMLLHLHPSGTAPADAAATPAAGGRALTLERHATLPGGGTHARTAPGPAADVAATVRGGCRAGGSGDVGGAAWSGGLASGGRRGRPSRLSRKLPVAALLDTAATAVPSGGAAAIEVDRDLGAVNERGH